MWSYETTFSGTAILSLLASVLTLKKVKLDTAIIPPNAPKRQASAEPFRLFPWPLR